MQGVEIIARRLCLTDQGEYIFVVYPEGGEDLRDAALQEISAQCANKRLLRVDLPEDADLFFPVMRDALAGANALLPGSVLVVCGLEKSKKIIRLLNNLNSGREAGLNFFKKPILIMMSETIHDLVFKYQDIYRYAGIHRIEK